MPEDFRDVLITVLYKNTGSKADCGNYWSFTLLLIAGNIFVLIITLTEGTLLEVQSGFRQDTAQLI